MNPLQQAIANHAQPEARRRIEVPEWSLDGGATPLVIYYTMVTLDDLQQVNEMAKSGAVNRIAPYLIVLKSTNEKGEQLFKLGDAHFLRTSAAPDVLQSIALKMMGRISEEEARGN